jgi:PPOX class probable F420-dependent enzyme
MSATIPPEAYAILDAPEFATIATLNPNGFPQQTVVWVERDGNDLLFSTIKGRRKTLNMERDPRVSLLVYPRDAPYTYVEVRGTVTMTEEGGRELIDRLNQLYNGTPRYVGDDGTDNVRIVCRVTPDKVIARLP